jgi:hypothetical protein
MRQKKFELMAEYILPRLEAGGQKFVLDRKELDNIIGEIYLLKQKDTNKRIFLIDREFSEDKYKLLLNIASGRAQYKGKLFNYEHASIFFKDGKTYFRSAAFGEKAGLKGIKYKQTKQLSLKDYDDDEVKRMIYLSQAELLALKRDNNIWYFQPESEKLKEALVKYRFTPVRFNYNHMDPDARFKPENKSSKRMYINRLVDELSDSIMMEHAQLRNANLPPEYKQNTLFGQN